MMDKHKTVLVGSLILTIVIFLLGVGINYFLDFMRVDEVSKVMSNQELKTESFLLDSEAAELFSLDKCNRLNSRILELKKSTHKVGIDLSNYGVLSYFKKKDFDYLKRKYFLLELQLNSLITEFNKQCDSVYVPVLFFYKIDDPVSERQGFILEDITREYNNQVAVLSFDIDYADEPLITHLVNKYNITSTPSVIIGNNVFRDITYFAKLNGTILKQLYYADKHASQIDFHLVANAAGISINELISIYTELASNHELPPIAQADARLVLGRLKKDNGIICSSLSYYDQAALAANLAANASLNGKTQWKNDETADEIAEKIEERAIIYEAIASLGCGRNRRAFLLEASYAWAELNNTFRSNLDKDLAYGLKPKLVFAEQEQAVIPNLTNLAVPSGATKLIIGTTLIEITENSTVVSQADRVSRDWLSGQIYQNALSTDIILRVFSERLSYDKAELHEEIGWHEGGRISELKSALPLTHKIASGALVAKNGRKWFAVNDKGVFMFEVPLDKISYPTAFFLADNIAVLPDTHGVNMLVEQSIRYKADAVLSDCDHPGKVLAAKYLSDNGIAVICYPDKYLPLALGNELKLVGSPPTTISANGILVGKRPIEINLSEKIIVMNSTVSKYALWYYQTPELYFTILSKSVPLNITYITIDSFSGMTDVIGAAEQLNASFVAVRVFNRNDYDKLSAWLSESASHRVMLFHSASYPYGQKIFREFPLQTTFDDPNPKFG